jgi:hypothetical protein
MMKQIKASIVASVFVFTSTSFGAATETGSNSAVSTPKASGPSITDSSSGAAKDNKMGQIMNTAIGGMNLAMGAHCASTCPHGGCCPMAPLFFLMGMQNMMQAGDQGKSAGQASGTVYATDIGLDSSGYDPNAVNRLNNDPEIKAGKDFAAAVAQGKAGFTYDPKTNTVTTAKGTKINGSDLNSSSALAAAGVPKAAIDMMGSMENDVVSKASKKVDKLGLKTNVASGEESNSGGGGSGGDSVNSGSGGAGANAYGAMAGRGSALGIDRDPAQVAGMQKNYNGEPIGVAGDSIFRMMTRRYKVKESQSTFLDESDTLMQK